MFQKRGLLVLALTVLSAVVAAKVGDASEMPSPITTPKALLESLKSQIRNARSSTLLRTYNVRSFGATGDGISDDTEAIQRAMDEMAAGGVLFFPSGRYRLSRTLTVSRHDTVMWGAGAILIASSDEDQAIFIQGDRSSIVGFELVGSALKRSQRLRAAKIVLMGNENEAVNNHIVGAANGGIETYRATGFRVFRNYIENTLADGIHVNWASKNGVVSNNIVTNAGDDLIAVVSFGTENLVRDVEISDNYVFNNSWGRGIAVVGGQDITIRKNVIRDIAYGAGIRIAHEAQYNTTGSSNILVEQNSIQHIQTRGTPLAKALGRRTHQGGIDLYAPDVGDVNKQVRQVLIRNNVIQETIGDGIKITGSGVCGIQLIDNLFEDVGGSAISAAAPVCPDRSISCSGNLLGLNPVTSSNCGNYSGNVTGAAGLAP